MHCLLEQAQSTRVHSVQQTLNQNTAADLLTLLYHYVIQEHGNHEGIGQRLSVVQLQQSGDALPARALH